jgi:hypothetical protein
MSCHSYATFCRGVRYPFIGELKEVENPGSTEKKIHSPSFWDSSMQNAELNHNNQPLPPFPEQV